MRNIGTARRRIIRRSHGRLGRAAAVTGLVAALVAVTGAPAAQAAETAPTCAATSSTTDWKSAASRADAAWSKAVTNIRHERYAKAADHLRVMKNQARRANTAATSLIGKPPTDPESDELPGVAAVLGVNGFDHRLTMSLLPLFSSRKGHHVVRALRRGLTRVDACRDVMLSTVIALRPAARDDYTDGLSDGIGAYQQELDAMAAALAGPGLTAGGRVAIERARTIVGATDLAMQPVFGGGERTSAPPR